MNVVPTSNNFKYRNFFFNLKVNQKLLLEDLYESRQCNRLLETETAEEAWSKINKTFFL